MVINVSQEEDIELICSVCNVDYRVVHAIAHVTHLC